MKPIEPMLAVLAHAPLDDPSLVYEPKYDGIRAIVEVSPRAVGGRVGPRVGPTFRSGVDLGGVVRIWSRNGNEKTAQFPEIVEALEAWAQTRLDPAGPDGHRGVVLDGEIVAIDARGRPLGFQALQGRIHTGRHGHPVSPRTSGSRASSNAAGPLAPVAFIAFDLLREGAADLRGRPLSERRDRLERLFPAGRVAKSSVLRTSEIARGDGRAMYARATAKGWEGVIAKRASSIYHSGKRTPDWRKIKLTLEQEFVVGGWTEPRGTRTHLGALMLGVRERSGSGPQAAGSRGRRGGALRYVGHVGTGFDDRELARLREALRPLEIAECPFENPPSANDRPHWVRPVLVAQVRFSEWTADGNLRHPVYLGLRDDKQAEHVVRENAGSTRQASGGGTRIPTPRAQGRAPASRRPRSLKPVVTRAEQEALIERLQALEESRRDGVLQLPDGSRLPITNLHKVFWPDHKRTKGDLFRFYVEVAPFLLPALADRPLVMKRFPNGVAAQPFYQHRVPEAPEGVRVEMVDDEEPRPQIIGGSLLTLMHTTQLAAISQDPWFSRIGSLDEADHVALDLDPMPGVGFAKVLEVACWLRDELERLGATGVPKTSGSDGLHIYIPLPPGTPYEAGLLFCQLVASLVVARHPKHASDERRIKSRGHTVYVDCLQNVRGRTLASAYSARASDFAGVSTPLTWKEVESGVEREDFTIATVPGRLRTTGDLWATLRTTKGVDLERALGKISRTRPS